MYAVRFSFNSVIIYKITENWVDRNKATRLICRAKIPVSATTYVSAIS